MLNQIPPDSGTPYRLSLKPSRSSAEEDEKIVEAAKANNFTNFSSYLERLLDELFIDRMEGNEEIFSRVMTDKEFRSAAHDILLAKFSGALAERGARNDESSGLRCSGFHLSALRNTVSVYFPYKPKEL
jgi:hypothetical protein